MAKQYKVLKIDILTRVSDVRGLEQYARIRAKTEGGTVFTVDVDDPDITPEKAAPVLLAKAQELDSILKL